MPYNKDYPIVRSPRGASKRLLFLKEYSTWHSMRQRCYCKADPGYRIYGGRGITICERWALFNNFVEDMGRCPPGKNSIDRLDPNLGYFKENCRWADPVEQAQTTRKSKVIELNGSKITVRQFSHLFPGRSKTAIRRNIENGLPPIEAALSARYTGWIAKAIRVSKTTTPYGTIYQRIRKLGMSLEEALAAPYNGKGRKGLPKRLPRIH